MQISTMSPSNAIWLAADSEERRQPSPYATRESVQNLDFVVKFARTRSELDKALEIRRTAYLRHHPELADLLAFEDRRDRQAGAIVFVALRKSDQEAIGSVRLESNAVRPLQLERDLELPDSLRGQHLLHATRFAVHPGAEGAVVRRALLKAINLYSLAREVKAILVSTIPPLERLYYRIGCRDLYPENKLVRLNEYRQVEVKLLIRPTNAPKELHQSEEGQRFWEFLNYYRHPDIRVFDAIQSSWENPRTQYNGELRGA
jgi:hypothetical protein